MTRREHVDVPAPALGGAGAVIVHGHYGRPFLVFPSERGRAWDFENNGMVEAVRPLLDDGRAKLYCVTSHDADSWSNRSLSIEDRARGHDAYERLDRRVGGAVHHGGLRRRPAGDRHRRLLAGGLPRAHLRAAPGRPLPAGDGLLRQLRPVRVARLGRAGRGGLLHQPDALRARSRRRPPRLAALPAVRAAGRRAGNVGGHHRVAASTRRMAWLLQERGLRCELDQWGHDVPHDWPSWQRQFAHHLPRFC